MLSIKCSCKPSPEKLLCTRRAFVRDVAEPSKNEIPLDSSKIELVVVWVEPAEHGELEHNFRERAVEMTRGELKRLAESV